MGGFEDAEESGKDDDEFKDTAQDGQIGRAM